MFEKVDYNVTITSNKDELNSENKVELETNLIVLIIIFFFIGLWILTIGVLVKLHSEIRKVKIQVDKLFKFMIADPDKNLIQKQSKASFKEVIDKNDNNMTFNDNSKVDICAVNQSTINSKSMLASTKEELKSNSLISSNVYADLMTLAGNQDTAKIQNFKLAGKNEDIVLAMNASQLSSLDSTSLPQSQASSSGNPSTTN